MRGAFDAAKEFINERNRGVKGVFVARDLYLRLVSCHNFVRPAHPAPIRSYVSSILARDH